jgi:outer membrane receptor protein involved in Fe transport
LTLYHSVLKNIIVRKGVPAPDEQENRGFVKFQGVEFEGKYQFNENFSILGNASYQENITDEGIEQSTFAPELMVKFGGSYNGLRGITLSAFNSYIGASTDLTQTEGAPDINPKADAYNMLTANLIADTAILWGLGSPGNSLLSVYLDNILDENVYAPDLNYAGVNNTIPHHWGFGAYVTYTYKF